MTGLPLIVTLSVMNGILVATNLSSLSHNAEMRQMALAADNRAAIAEANLRQAERKWMACHESGVYTVGTDIYQSRVHRSKLTVRDVPEVKGL